MRRLIRTRWLVAAAALAALAPGMVAGVPAGPAAATVATPAADPAAPPEGPAATIALHSATPSLLTPADDELVLTGTVQNIGDEPVRNAQVLPRFSRVPLESRAEIGRVGTDQNLNWGARYSDDFDQVDDALQPGETQPFTLRVSTDLLDLGRAGVYIIGADVMGSPADGQERIRLDTARTVVPWLPADEDLPSVPVGVLWPLADRPALMPDGTLLDDSLATQVGTADPLSTLVNTASDAPVTWAVDPDLVDTANAMTDGYRVVSPSGVTEGSQANSDAAGSWLTSLQQATAGSDVLMLPYATPDVAALATAEPDLAATVTRRAVSVSGSSAGAFGAPDPVGWLDDGSVGTDALTALAGAGAGSVVVSGDAVRSGNDDSAARFDLGDQSLDAVVTDPGLSDAVADAAVAPDPRAGALEVRQRWYAETAMIAMSAAATGAPIEPLVVAPPLRWRPAQVTAEAVIDSWTSIPWVETAPVDATAGPAAATVTPDPAEGTNMLPPANVDATAELYRQAGSYAGLLADTDASNRSLALAAVRSASTGWRSDPAAGAAYASSITDELAAQLDEVSVTVPESVTLSSRTGTFPLTVTNELDRAIVIGLDITSANVDRLQIEDVAERRIEPGARELVNVTAQAAANGKVPIDVQLTTGTGTAIGPARPTVVNATDYGTIGWIIVGGAGALFAAAVVRRTTRRRASGDAGTLDGADHDAGAPAGSPSPDDDQPRRPGAGGPDTGSSTSPTEPLRGTSR